MADTDGKSSTSQGATPPPSPSPSTVAAGAEGPPRRINHLQPQPVTSRVYNAIAEVNGGFEKLTQDLQSLQQFNFFPPDFLDAWLNTILYLQAHVNYRLLEPLGSREMNNAAYYDRLCLQWDRQFKDPDDVLIEAEHRRQEIAAEEKRREQDAEEDAEEDSEED